MLEWCISGMEHFVHQGCKELSVERLVREKLVCFNGV